MTALAYAVLALLSLGYLAIAMAWSDLESPRANSFAMVASACVLVCVAIGAAMAAREREAGL